MTVSRAFLERCAAESGYEPGLLEKVVRLGEVASAVRDSPVLRPALLLKRRNAAQPRVRHAAPPIGRS